MQIDYPMKKNGLFILRKQDIDDFAERYLAEYAPEVLRYPQPFNIRYHAEEVLGLTILERYMTKQCSVIGAVFFDDTRQRTMTPELVEQIDDVYQGTIMIDPRQENSDIQTYRTRFTIGHEVGHWILHRTYHSPGNTKYSLRAPRSYIACRGIGSFRYPSNGCWSDEMWEEWQADHFSGAVLLPATTFRKAASDLIPHTFGSPCLWEGVGSAEPGKVITELSEIFQVSKSAIRVRLRQMNMLKTFEII